MLKDGQCSTAEVGKMCTVAARRAERTRHRHEANLVEGKGVVCGILCAVEDRVDTVGEKC